MSKYAIYSPKGPSADPCIVYSGLCNAVVVIRGTFNQKTDDSAYDVATHELVVVDDAERWKSLCAGPISFLCIDYVTWFGRVSLFAPLVYVSHHGECRMRQQKVTPRQRLIVRVA
eukprot:6214560-Pleurochrysis_carterae.AAC.7